MKVEGECLCGGCAWQADVDPERVFLCHCDDCQVQAGSAFRSTALIEPPSFTLTRGELRAYVKTAESGAQRELAFCPVCGTNVYGAPGDGQPGMMSLRIGPLAQRRELKPVAQVWCRSRLDWLDDLADLPGMPTQPGVPASEG
jgi:hypothetical protein